MDFRNRHSQAAARLKVLPGELETVAGYGVPTEQVTKQQHPSLRFQPVRKLLDKPTLSLNDADQDLLAASSDAGDRREEALREIKERATPRNLPTRPTS